MKWNQWLPGRKGISLRADRRLHTTVGSHVNSTQFVVNGLTRANAGATVLLKQLDLSLIPSFSLRRSNFSSSLECLFINGRMGEQSKLWRLQEEKEGQITFMPSPPSLDSLSLKERLCVPPPPHFKIFFTSPSPPLRSPSFFFTEAAKTSKLIKVDESPFPFFPHSSARTSHQTERR